MSAVDHSTYQAFLKSREALHYWELHSVVCACSRSDIPVMLLKGAIDIAVPRNRPPEFIRRYIGDLDILINKSDLERAVRILHELGYQPERTGNIPDDWDKGLKTLHELGYHPDYSNNFIFIGEMSFLKLHPVCRVDLHFHLDKFPRCRGLIDVDQVWERATKIEFDETHVFVPSHTDQVWFQLVHFFYQHSFSLEEMIGPEGRLFYLLDMIHHHREHIDWQWLGHQVSSNKMSICLYFLLYGVYKKHHRYMSCFYNSRMVERAAFLWEWMFWAQNLPPILDYAIGRFTILCLFRGYRLYQTCKILFRESVKGMSKKDLLGRYRLSNFPSLYRPVCLVHLMRLLLLNFIIKLCYLGFILKRKTTFLTHPGNTI
ncbi:MAG: nucleotidyltransferase family protein [Spirochaetota bacterium]